MQCSPEDLFEIYGSDDLIVVVDTSYTLETWFVDNFNQARGVVDYVLEREGGLEVEIESRRISNSEVEISFNQDLPKGFMDLEEDPLRWDNFSEVRLDQTRYPEKLLMYTDLHPRGGDYTSSFVLGTPEELAGDIRDELWSIEEDKLVGHYGEYFLKDPESAQKVWDAYQLIQ